LLRGLIPAVVTDLTALVLAWRLAVGDCSPLLFLLVTLRVLNPFMSILYHCHDLDVFHIKDIATEDVVRQVDMFIILVATTTDLAYAATILMVPECFPVDIPIIAIGACFSQIFPRIVKDGMFSLLMLRAAYLGFLYVPDPVAWGARMAVIGILINALDESRPEWPDRPYRGIRKYFGLYDIVHVCWFIDLAIMLYLGDAGRTNEIGTVWALHR
jgi:hypothetical protein